ncbi:MAG TPA: nucleotidyltransferase family protein [Solirubrobacteraceae bacterium]
MICGLVLAAGAGTRFAGTPAGPQSKLLAPLDGRPLLEHAVLAQCEVSELERVVVVLGMCSEEVLASVRFGRAEPVVCSEWARGQSASLRCGLGALPGAAKVIVTLGDEPRITAAAIRRFVDLPPGARAVYDGRPGHPVVLGPAQIQALAAVSGDTGARDLLGSGPEVECSDLCSGRDVDTLDDLEEIRDEARAVL